MVELVRQMKSIAFIPVFAKPNAGMPELVNDKSVYRMTPEEFAEDMKMIIEAGAGMVGGCCGTRPEHIKALADMASKMPVPEISSEHVRCISSERSSLIIDLDAPFKVVGERINPTGKKKLQAELREGSLELVMNMAEEQVDKGASILDINVGMNGIDERDMMLKVVYQVSQAVNLPLCLDSSSPEVLEAALRIYPGRALVNSVSLEKVKMEEILPLVKKYGAMFILLPLSDKGLPESPQEKEDIINTVLGMRIDLRAKRPLLANKTGGMSGPAIFPLAVRMVWQVYEAVRIPIIGMGGVTRAEDVLELMLAGATAVEVGAANLVNPYACRDIVRDLPQAMQNYNIQNLKDIIGGAHHG